MTGNKTLPLALTVGDPCGVGPEIIKKWLPAQTGAAHRFVPIGPPGWLRELGIEGIGVGAPDYVLTPGHPNGDGARIAWAAMREAASGCREGRYAGVVTGPVSKQALAEVGYPFPGQTEFFAAEWGGEPTMGFVGERLRVVLASWHLPLDQVCEQLRKHPEWLVRAVRRADGLCRRSGVENPRIGVCGLNPHAGENGLLGMDEREWINPLLKKLRVEISGLSDALPGDSVFHRHLRGDFDAVVALYHDQGLGPLKTVEFDSAVNVTLGLPYVRTSPDHGTAFDIAGRGLASSRSWDAAVVLAERLAGVSP